MIINIIVFLLPLLDGVNVMNMSSKYLASIGGLFGPSVILEGEIWRLVSAMFLHGGIEHILMNMLSLFIVGRSLEMFFSKTSYLIIYFISAFLGSLISIYFHPVTVGIGASGAIFGLFGALIGFVLVHRKRMQDDFMEFMKSFGLLLLLNLGIGLLFPSVDLSAHIGGLVAGIIGGIFVALHPKNIWIYLGLMLSVMYLFYSYLPILYVDPNDVLYQ